MKRRKLFKRQTGMFLETLHAMILLDRRLRHFSDNVVLETHLGLGVLPDVACKIFHSLT